jgi:hypothetical protein
MCMLTCLLVPYVLRRYLVDNDPLLPTWQVLLVFLLQLLGYYIFRSANSEKDAFRTNPDSPEVSELGMLVFVLSTGW